jgi:hypothetical protein
MVEGYKQLLEEIEIHENLLESHRISYQYYTKIADSWTPGELKAMSYSDMPKGSSIDLDAGVVFTKAIHHQNRMKEEKEVIHKLTERKNYIDTLIKGKNTKEAVKILKEVGYSNKQIADMVYITDRHVMRIVKELEG